MFFKIFFSLGGRDLLILNWNHLFCWQKIGVFSSPLWGVFFSLWCFLSLPNKKDDLFCDFIGRIEWIYMGYSGACFCSGWVLGPLMFPCTIHLMIWNNDCFGGPNHYDSCDTSFFILQKLGWPGGPSFSLSLLPGVAVFFWSGLWSLSWAPTFLVFKKEVAPWRGDLSCWNRCNMNASCFPNTTSWSCIKT